MPVTGRADRLSTKQAGTVTAGACLAHDFATRPELPPVVGLQGLHKTKACYVLTDLLQHRVSHIMLHQGDKEVEQGYVAAVTHLCTSIFDLE